MARKNLSSCHRQRTDSRDPQTLESPTLESPSVDLTDQQWKEKLSPEEYHVLREAGTEQPFVGEYTNTKTQGIYSCRACGTELFRSEEKFDSHCGWPSFFSPLAQDRIIERADYSLGHVRTEVLCAHCHSHLGHVFAGEGYETPTDLRYCINSISMKLISTDPESESS